MADIEYSIKSTLPIEVHVGASEASATICWLGAVKDNTNCLKCDEEKIYCENVYIGANGCIEGESSERRIESALTWNNLSIPYVIIQDPAICSTCGEVIEECDILNHWVSPYVVTPDMKSTTLYWEYWLTKEDDCEIFREKVLSSTTINVSTDIPCDQEDRVVTGDVTVSCDKTIKAEYYIQKPDVCCDLSGDCYEINEIVYNPTSVSSEGGLVDFSFDYKRIEIDEKCETKETYGTYFGKWQVPPCKGDDCCYTKTIQSAFTWFDICGRGDVSACTISSNTEYDDGDIVFIPNTVEGDTPIKFSHEVLNDKNTIYLSILRDRSVSADCDVHCDFDTLYCVDKSSIKMEYYDYDTRKWSGFTEDEYIFPYYGGRLKVSWNYYIITVYDDCKVGVSSGNPYTDLLTVLEYDDCKDHEDVTTFRVDIDGTPCTTGGTASVSPQGICASNNSTRNLSRGDNEDSGEGEECKITVTSVTACTSGGSVTIKPLENIVENKEEYKFKKGLCDLLPSQLEHVKRNLPASLQYVCDEEEKCNEFTVTYYQFKKDCNPDCVPCFPQYMIDEVFSGGSAVTLTCREGCDLTIKAYGDGEKINDTFKNDCSGWVTVNINKPDVTFTIAQNDGPYRRGKVIFLHDDKCEEEIVINQYGPIDEFEEYVPDPGYDCDLVINDITICSSGGTGTITPDGGESKTCELTLTLSKNELCADEEGANLKITVGGSETCDDTKITFTLTNSTVSGCAGKRLIGYYKYNCSNFNQNLLKYNIDDSDWTMVLDAPTNKKGNVYVVTKDNPSMTELNTVGFYLDYDGNDFTGWITIKQSPRTSDCDDYGEEFEALLSEFNGVLRNNNLTKVEHGTDLYTYLGESYQTAEKAYNGESESYGLFRLFYESTYDQVFVEGRPQSMDGWFANGKMSQWGTDNTYEDGTVLSATTAWLMAMQLSEIYNNTGTSTNYQTELFKKAYQIGGGRYIPIYGKFNTSSQQYNGYTVKGDVNIGRLAASAIYAVIRSDYSFADIDGFRSEVGRSAIDKNTSWSDLSASVKVNCSNTWDGNNRIGYSVNLNDIFPSAAGPFATNYYFGATVTPEYCTTVPTRNYPQEQIRNVSANELFVSTSKNYIFDEIADAYITASYNLMNSDVNIDRAVQAIADEEDENTHMFANKTYYKYDSYYPKGYFKPGSPSDYDRTFDGVFSKTVIGKDLSSKLTELDGSSYIETELADFFSGVAYMGSGERVSILYPQWGRRRPGQGERDYMIITGLTTENLYHNGEKVGTPRYVEGNNDAEISQNLDTNCYTCIRDYTKVNWLNDATITNMVGSGTKQGGPTGYYCDMLGNGSFENGDPYYNDPDYGSGDAYITYCAPLHAATYPSGHSAEAWEIGLFLIMMLPGKWYEIYMAAYKYSVSRTIVRAHWNSDIIYGRLAATVIAPIINAFEFSSGGHDFRAMFERTKLEVRNS